MNDTKHDKQPSWHQRLVRLFLLRDLRNVEEDIAALEATCEAWRTVIADNVYVQEKQAGYLAQLARKRKRAEWLRKVLHAQHSR